MLKFGKLMNHQWQLKKELAKNVSNKEIDKTYNRAIKLGAVGGKLCGSGGGGFLMLIIPPKKKKKNHKLIRFIEYKI